MWLLCWLQSARLILPFQYGKSSGSKLAGSPASKARLSTESKKQDLLLSVNSALIFVGILIWSSASVRGPVAFLSTTKNGASSDRSLRDSSDSLSEQDTSKTINRSWNNRQKYRIYKFSFIWKTYVIISLQYLPNGWAETRAGFARRILQRFVRFSGIHYFDAPP